MPFLCCGVRYTKTNPSTYDCIETDLIKTQTISDEIIENVQEYVKTNLIATGIDHFQNYQPPEFIKREINKEKVIKEIVESLTCKKNGCRRVNITRYNSKNKKIGEVQELKGYEADFYLLALAQYKISKRLPQKSPLRTIPSAKKIPLVYGEPISPTKTRRRYNMKRKCWADKYKKGIIVNKWIPDIIESEILRTVIK